jgi:hypothetical protein
MGERGEPAKETPRPNSTWRESPMATLERRKADLEANKQIAKEIIIAYIQSNTTGLSTLFPKPGNESLALDNFENVWERTLNAVSGVSRWGGK